MSSTFSSLKIYNYRVYACGALVSNIGTWMGRVAQDWVVLTELTDGSATALGIVTGLQFLPMLVLAPWTGTISDRFNKRHIMFITQSTMAVTALLMGVLVLTGLMELWHMYLLAALQGSAAAVDNPARQTFVSEMVPRERISNAVGLNSASFNSARLIGPGVAGLLIAWIGTGPTFLVNTSSFVAVLLALALMRTHELSPAPISRGKGKIREGLAYVRHRPDLILILVMVFMLGTFGMNFQMTTALMATEVFDKGATGYGLLGSIMAVGSLSAALLSARRENPRLRHLIGALAGFSVSTLFLGLAPTYETFAILLIPTGLCALTVMVTANAKIQLSVDPVVRGRVMALYMAIFMGGTPLGAPAIGWLGEQFGARWTILIGTITCAVTVLAAMIYVVRTDDIHIRYERQARRRFVIERGPVEPVPEKAA